MSPCTTYLKSNGSPDETKSGFLAKYFHTSKSTRNTLSIAVESSLSHIDDRNSFVSFSRSEMQSMFSIRSTSSSAATVFFILKKLLSDTEYAIFLLPMPGKVKKSWKNL